jgi:hypothetical protein
MRPPFPTALLTWTLAGVLAAASVHARDNAQPRPKGLSTPIQALHLGDVLFNAFQDKYFSAITGLMVSQHFERLAPQRDEAEVLRGGLLLSYGMHNEAGAIFAALIDQGAAPSVRDRAWFYLAKSRYQRGFDAEAEAALARIQGPLPAPLAEERGLLHAQLLMARADYAGAAGVLGAIPAASAGPIARFNLGVALIKSGDVAQGTAWLDKLGRAPADNEEQRSVRDRANLALGVAALSQRHADDARRLLERVRLSGVHANQALLGFGWAAVAQWQPALALVPWNELVARDASDPAVLEGLIALPFAHAELGAYGTSLKLYKQAVAAYAAEGRRLDASIAAIGSGKLIEGLLSRDSDDRGWLLNLGAQSDIPHAAHLSQMLAQPEFQEAFKSLADLRFLENNLRLSRERLGRFRDDMLNARRHAAASGRPAAPASERVAALAQMQRDDPSRFERLPARIETLIRQIDTTLPRVTALGREQQSATRQIAAAVLMRQKERLRAYAAQANFEIAQLLDRGATD